MHEPLTTPLPGSWLSSRLGVNLPRDRAACASAASCSRYATARGEWLYPAWQFGPGGTIPAGVREAVKAARAAGLSEARLWPSLRQPRRHRRRTGGCSTCSSRAAPTTSSTPSAR